MKCCGASDWNIGHSFFICFKLLFILIYHFSPSLCVKEDEIRTTGFQLVNSVLLTLRELDDCDVCYQLDKKNRRRVSCLACCRSPCRRFWFRNWVYRPVNRTQSIVVVLRPTRCVLGGLLSRPNRHPWMLTNHHDAAFDPVWPMHS
jgi:hypothetical protein